MKSEKRILKLSSLSGCPIVLVFTDEILWRNSDGIPLNGAVKCTFVMKKHDFRPISRCISETISDMAIVTVQRF